MDAWQNPCNHIAEHMIGVPYYYNKLTDVPYYKKNKKKKFYFSSSVRYLDFNLVWNFDKIKKIIAKTKIVRSAKLGDGHIHLLSSRQYLEFCLELLTKNQFALINKEQYLKK
jgi:aminoglycoside N3'-acetyltransferase